MDETGKIETAENLLFEIPLEIPKWWWYNLTVIWKSTMSKLNKKKTPGTGWVLHSPVTLKVSLMRGFGGKKYAIKIATCGYKHHLSVVQKPFYIYQENFDNKMMFGSLKS